MQTFPDLRLPIEGVSSAMLRTIAVAVKCGQVAAPVTAFAVTRVAPCPPALATALARLSGEGMSAQHLAMLLQTAADVGDANLSLERALELVWTGPEPASPRSRETPAVVNELFSRATRSVLVSTFVIQNGKSLFATLADRLDSNPALSVRLFVNVPRKSNDTRDDSEILREFAAGLKTEWPGKRRPEVFYDPRTVSSKEEERASWHAKCVLVDDQFSFVTSANFTEWAQQRNVEAGVMIQDAQFTRRLRAQFDALVESRAVRRLAGF